jgi:hypothetical protein
VAGKPDVDLDSMTAEQLTNLINMAQAKRAGKLEEARAALITEMAKRRWSSAFRSISSTPWPREPAGLAPTADARRERIPERPCRPSIVVRALENTGRRRDEFRVLQVTHFRGGG